MVRIKNCPLGYVDAYNPSKYCYKLHPDVYTFKEAKQICEKEGGKMLELESPLQTMSINGYFSGSKTSSYSTWLGIQRQEKAPRYQSLKGKPMAIQDWLITNATELKECVIAHFGGLQDPLQNNASKWSTTECRARHQFICMKRGIPNKFNTTILL